MHVYLIIKMYKSMLKYISIIQYKWLTVYIIYKKSYYIKHTCAGWD